MGNPLRVAWRSPIVLLVAFVAPAAMAQGAATNVNVSVTGGVPGSTAKVTVHGGGGVSGTSADVPTGRDRSIKTGDGPQRITVSTGGRSTSIWVIPVAGATVSERVDLASMPLGGIGPSRRSEGGSPIGIDSAALRRLIQDAAFAVKECDRKKYDQAVGEIKAALKAHEDYVAQLDRVIDELRQRTKIEPSTDKITERIQELARTDLPPGMPTAGRAASDELGSYFDAVRDRTQAKADLEKIRAGLAEVPPWVDCPPKPSGAQQATPQTPPPATTPTTPEQPPGTPPKAEDGLPLPEKYRRFGACQPSRPGDGEYAQRMDRLADRFAERAAEHATKAYYASGEAKIAHLRTSEQWLAACQVANQMSPSWRGAATPVLAGNELQRRTIAADRLATEIGAKARDEGGRAEAELYGEMAWGFHCAAASPVRPVSSPTIGTPRNERTCQERVDRLVAEAKSASPARRIVAIMMLGRALSGAIPTHGPGGYGEHAHATRAASGIDALAVVGAFLLVQELVLTGDRR